MSTIDFLGEKLKREVNPALRFTDDRGVVWCQFSVSYEHGPEGRNFAFFIWATSLEDAEARIAEIRGTATLGGICLERIET